MEALTDSSQQNLDTSNQFYIVDIGAAGGLDQRWRKNLPNLTAILFEPDPESYVRLQSISGERDIICNTALYSSQTTLDFFVCRDSECSSIYRPNRSLLEHFPQAERFDIVKTSAVPVDTLKRQLFKAGVARTDFIKLDVQGAELDILQGTDSFLPTTLGLQIEVAFQEIYSKQPLFHQVHQYLTERGFALIDLQKTYWSLNLPQFSSDYNKGQLIFGDALYFRLPQSLLSDDKFNPNDLSRAIMLYLCYGYTDLAQHLLTLMQSKGRVDTADSIHLAQLIAKKRQQSPLPLFRGRSRLYHGLKQFAKKFFFVSLTPWNRGSDATIGN